MEYHGPTQAGATEEIDGHDPLAYTRKMHIFVVKEAITNLEGIRNRKTELPISVLKDLLARLEASNG